MMWENDEIVLRFLKSTGLRYAMPSATGMDGVILYNESTKKEKFISGRYIDEAVQFARSMRTGFIRGDKLWTLPDWYIRNIHQEEFKRMLISLTSNYDI